eukprot:scaffold32895_cov216-Skeletonema_marinoi.AAC.2
MMKLAVISALAGSAAAFAPAQTGARSTSLNAFSVDTIPGALAPVGLFDPLGFAEKADEMTLKRYREAELTHGRVGMLATVGFLVGEAVESKTNKELQNGRLGMLAAAGFLAQELVDGKGIIEHFSS